MALSPTEELLGTLGTGGGESGTTKKMISAVAAVTPAIRSIKPRQPIYARSQAAGDADNDGYVDLFLTQWGHNVFLHNLGHGTFRDETRERGLDLPGARWSTGCAFLDYDRDGWLDLAVPHYVDYDAHQTPRPRERSGCKWQGIPVPCGPRGLKGESMTLYHNDGHGHFTDVTKQTGVETPPNHYGFTGLTGDFDTDGWPDFFVACDSTPSL